MTKSENLYSRRQHDLSRESNEERGAAQQRAFDFALVEYSQEPRRRCQLVGLRIQVIAGGAAATDERLPPRRRERPAPQNHLRVPQALTYVVKQT